MKKYIFILLTLFLFSCNRNYYDILIKDCNKHKLFNDTSDFIINHELWTPTDKFIFQGVTWNEYIKHYEGEKFQHCEIENIDLEEILKIFKKNNLYNRLQTRKTDANKTQIGQRRYTFSRPVVLNENKLIYLRYIQKERNGMFTGGTIMYVFDNNGNLINRFASSFIT